MANERATPNPPASVDASGEPVKLGEFNGFEIYPMPMFVTLAVDGSSAPPLTLTLTFNADGEVDALAARARGVPAVGRSAVQGPVDTGWNTRDLRVTDPDGHQLIFTARNPNPDPEQAGRWKAMFDAARKS